MKSYPKCMRCDRVVFKKELCLLCFRNKQKLIIQRNNTPKVKIVKKKLTSDELIQKLLVDERYRISCEGYVETTVGSKGFSQVPWRLINLNKTFQGYCRITYQARTIQLHRIIYAAFHGPLIQGRVINHIDGNPGNNKADNLEQITRKKNIKLSKNKLNPRKTYTEEFRNQVRYDHYTNGLSYRELSF